MIINGGRRIQYLRDLNDYRVKDGNPDARGWMLVDADKRRIGRIDGLLIDINSEKVRYLDIELDESFLDSEMESDSEVYTIEVSSHMIVPVGLTKLDIENHLVVSRELTRDRYALTNRFKRGEEITADYEYHVVSTLIGPHAISNYQRSVDTRKFTTDECFYSTNYFNEYLFFQEK